MVAAWREVWLGYTTYAVHWMDDAVMLKEPSMSFSCWCVMQNAFVSMYLINNCTTLLDLSSNVSDLAGYTHR